MPYVYPANLSCPDHSLALLCPACPFDSHALLAFFQMSFKILPASESLVYVAAEFQAEYPIPYADCFALACAQEHSATLVTGDPEFKQVAHLVNIN